MESGKIKLASILARHAPLAVALSGGVDSTFLLAMARDTLEDQVIALTSVSPLHAERELADARAIAAELGVAHIAVQTNRLKVPGFVMNRRDRCYICKTVLWQEFSAEAQKNGISHVADGVCVDDLNEFRPGIAAGREQGILSPLAEAGFTKADIRAYSKKKGLFTWDKPAGTCLATRIPAGTPITPERLNMVAQAESVLHNEGFTQCRVRLHDTLARIEVPPENITMLAEPDTRTAIDAELKKIGFCHVSVDMDGYRNNK
ncbi:MAG: ATP-dependent sacrificial sulfur transferase LarE [Thermodesulfobacteriota bacterium]|nr:ATP-dependent sacrificial sulfur transferase LarE [Thermodesulfobacteriota bacterium]